MLPAPVGVEGRHMKEAESLLRGGFKEVISAERRAAHKGHGGQHTGVLQNNSEVSSAPFLF